MTTEPPMIHIFNINELTAPWFALLTAIGRPSYVLAVDSLFPPLHPVLDRLVHWAVATGHAKRAIELCPELDHVREYPTRILLYDIFAETEMWQNTQYGFSKADRTVPVYAVSYKQLTCNYTRHKHLPYLLVEAVLRALAAGGRKAKIIGLQRDTVAGLEAYWGCSFSPEVRTGPSLGPLLNPLIGTAILAYSLGWIASRLRLGPGRPQNFFLAADYMEDPRDFRLYHELADGGPILLVIRDPTRNVERHRELDPYRSCLQTDGCFGPMGALAAMAMVIGDGLRLMWHLRTSPPQLFYQVAALPYRRAVLRAFFNRFRPKFFWGRDDYNVEHILRREELSRVGGTSLGINHGFPVYCHLFPVWRYISFDRYYVFGRAIYDRYLKDSWASDMAVVPVGSFGATRADY